jgi:preprotein translocase subunit Sss1
MSIHDQKSFPTGEDEQMEARLWDYIDGLSDQKEKTVIEKLIEEQAIWRAKYNELLDLHQMINGSELEQPSMRFTKNVMDEIAKYQIAPATKNYINNKVIWGIGIFFLAIIVGFLIYGIGQIDWTSASDNSSTFGFDLTNVDYSKMFNNNVMNVVMMLNVVLGLMLLDRFLNNKKKKIEPGNV